MPQTIYIKEYDTSVTIPDGADMNQVQSALQKQFPAKENPNKIARSQGKTMDVARQAAGSYMKGMQELGKTPESGIGRGVVRPLMQMGGAALGATATAPIPGASVVGASAGYLGGGKAYDIGESALGFGKPKTTGQVVGEMPRELAEGAASQAFNIGLDKFATAAKPYLSRMAEKVYSSAAKMPLAKGWIKERPRIGGEVSDRLLATQAAIHDKIPISAKGLEMAKTAEEEAKKLVDSTVNQLTAEGWTGKRSDLLKGLDKVYERAAVSGDPQGAARIIDSVAKKFMKGPETLTPNDVLNIKRQMYKEASDYGMKFKSFQESATKGISNEAMKVLEGLNPSLARFNQNDAAYIKLVEALEKATSREINKYHMGLQDVLGASGGAAYGALKGGDATSASEGAAAGLLFTKVMRDPMVLSHLSFALDKASKMTPNPVLERIFSTVLAKGTVSLASPQEAQAKEVEQQPQAAPAKPEVQATPAIVSKETSKPQQRLDEATAMAIMKEANNDPVKAREIAKKRGYIF